ncbi:ATP-binding cassette domain-containing protein [Breznakiella homolactica]|uniref:ATP-binding cassette domain-containing protein n=1 Tax=Breznakiella homolactica TaxID=2798577 RepID=UPI001CBA6847|nr:ATP-binding cassette domain-containing protein [Breznakiella homolactica]
MIELKDVSFSAQNMDVVRNISYDFEGGKTTALVGPSGGGKSTVLKLAAGLLLPTSGKVLFRGQDISAMGRPQTLAFRRESAVVFQDSALWANQTLFQTLELPLKIHYPDMDKDERESRIAEVTAAVGYKRALHIRPALLSMGEQKLISFARALLCNPSILFLDEWTESLDDEAARRLVGIVRRRKADNNTILFISHDLEIIKELAEYVVMVIDGRLSLQVTGEEMEADRNVAKIVEKGISS